MSTESFDEKLQRVKHLCQYLKDRKIVITDDRKEWLQVMFALRELGPDGYDLFQDLSAESTTKYDEKECKRQWDKMQSQPTGQGSADKRPSVPTLGCTLGTLYHLAEQHGADLKEVAREWYQQHPELQPPSPEEQKALLRAQAEARARQQQEAEQAERERRLHPDRPVAIVESEKTALICSELLADRGYIWLATGGKQQLRPESFEPLFGRSVTVFPDTDPTGETFHAWQQVAHQAQRFTQRVIRVQNELERVATPDQRQRKIDIADLLTEPQIQQFQLSEMRCDNPVLDQLISMFHLQLPTS